MALHLRKFCPAESLILLQLSRSFIWLIVYFSFPSSAYASCMYIPVAHIFAVDVCKSIVRSIPFVCSSLHSFNCCNVVRFAPKICGHVAFACLGMKRHQSALFLHVQRSINLSPQQKKELLAGRHYYLSKMSEVLRQRESLLSTLEVTTPCPLTLACSMQQCGCSCICMTASTLFSRKQSKPAVTGKARDPIIGAAVNLR